jgi:hypothetical protein
MGVWGLLGLGVSQKTILTLQSQTASVTHIRIHPHTSPCMSLWHILFSLAGTESLHYESWQHCPRTPPRGTADTFVVESGWPWGRVAVWTCRHVAAYARCGSESNSRGVGTSQVCPKGRGGNHHGHIAGAACRREWRRAVQTVGICALIRCRIAAFRIPNC